MSIKRALIFLLILLILLAITFTIIYFNKYNLSKEGGKQDFGNKELEANKESQESRELTGEEKKQQMIETLDKLNQQTGTTTLKRSQEEMLEILKNLSNQNNSTTTNSKTGEKIDSSKTDAQNDKAEEQKRQELLDILSDLNKKSN